MVDAKGAGGASGARGALALQCGAAAAGTMIGEALGDSLVEKLLAGLLIALVGAFLTAPGRHHRRRIVAVTLLLALLHALRGATAWGRARYDALAGPWMPASWTAVGAAAAVGFGLGAVGTTAAGNWPEPAGGEREAEQRPETPPGDPGDSPNGGTPTGPDAGDTAGRADGTDAQDAPRPRQRGRGAAPSDPGTATGTTGAPPEPPVDGPGGCDPNYSGCVPAYPPDVDCDQVDGPVKILGSDPHGLDHDGDGDACE